MARNLKQVVLREQAIEHFDRFILPIVQAYHEQDGEPDWPARSEAWNNWTDSMCKNNQISDWQYNNWSHPPSCGD